MKRYLFIDRDGTLVREPDDFQVDDPAKVEFEPMVIPALLRLRDMGYTFVMVSNQDGLGTDSFPLAAFTAAHELIVNTLESQGVVFEQILICPHKPEDGCACRKPATGLVNAYLRDTSWDRENSAVIGDRPTDMALAKAMGLRGILYSRDHNGWEAVCRDLCDRPRAATVSRKTLETEITVAVNLDEPGGSAIATGMGFFDHMLEQIATHGGISLKVRARGDLHVDCHHTIEDTALALGEALKRALGDKRGIARFGFTLPMDEVYAQVACADALEEIVKNPDGVSCALDISGRPHVEFGFEGLLAADKVGQMPTDMVPHFFESLAMAMGLTLHMRVGDGNAHHQVEALFKAFGRALRMALARRGGALPSSKGVL